MTALEKIEYFNRTAGLLDLGYSDTRESAYPIEEALEGFENLQYLDIDTHEYTPKEISRAIVDTVHNGKPIEDVDRFDKHLDAIVFAYGSLLKLGLSLEQINAGLNIVMDANLTKLSVGKDPTGKQLKPSNFISPEPLLQEILDER